jgi:hypothetical protein
VVNVAIQAAQPHDVIVNEHGAASGEEVLGHPTHPPCGVVLRRMEPQFVMVREEPPPPGEESLTSGVFQPMDWGGTSPPLIDLTEEEVVESLEHHGHMEAEQEVKLTGNLGLQVRRCVANLQSEIMKSKKSHQSSEGAGDQRIRLGECATANVVRQWGTITARRKLRTKPNKQKKRILILLHMLHFIYFSYPFYTDNILSICLPITTFIYFSYPFYAAGKLLIYVPFPFVCCSMCLFLCFQCIESRVTSWHKLTLGEPIDRDIPSRYLKKKRGTNKYFFPFVYFGYSLSQSVTGSD